MNGFKFQREKAGLLQSAVCATLGVTQGSVSQWESGRGKPRAEHLLKLANLYNCTVDALLCDHIDVTLPLNQSNE